MDELTEGKSRVAHTGAIGLYFLCVLGFVTYIWIEGHARSAEPGWVTFWCLITLALLWAPKHPLIGVCCYVLVTYGISNQGPELDIMLSMRVPDGVSILALLAWRLARPKQTTDALLHHPVMVTGLLLVGWIALCLAVALLRGVPWPPYLRHDPSAFGQAAIMCLVAADVLRHSRDSLTLSSVLIIAILGRAALQGKNGIYLENYIATPLVLGVPIAALGARVTSYRAAQILFVASALVMGVVLLATQNRSSAVAACAMLIALVWQSRRRSFGKVLGIVAVLAMVVAMVAPTAYLDRFRALWDPNRMHATAGLDRSTALERLDLWAAGWNMAMDQPLLGVGPGNFPIFLKMYRPGSDPLAAHSNYVQMIAEAGFPGGILYLAFFAGAIVMLGRTGGRAHLGWRAPAARMLQLSLVGYLAGGIFNSRHDFVLAYILVGWAVAICKPAEPHPLAPRPHAVPIAPSRL